MGNSIKKGYLGGISNQKGDKFENICKTIILLEEDYDTFVQHLHWDLSLWKNERIVFNEMKSSKQKEKIIYNDFFEDLVKKIDWLKKYLENIADVEFTVHVLNKEVDLQDLLRLKTEKKYFKNNPIYYDELFLDDIINNKFKIKNHIYKKEYNVKLAIIKTSFAIENQINIFLADNVKNAIDDILDKNNYMLQEIDIDILTNEDTNHESLKNKIFEKENAFENNFSKEQVTKTILAYKNSNLKDFKDSKIVMKLMEYYPTIFDLLLIIDFPEKLDNQLIYDLSKEYKMNKQDIVLFIKKMKLGEQK